MSEPDRNGVKTLIWKARCPIAGCGATIASVMSGLDGEFATCAEGHRSQVEWPEAVSLGIKAIPRLIPAGNTGTPGAYRS